MSTHSLRKKLLRYRPETTKRERMVQTARKYAPWVAAICVGAYLPPKVLSSSWILDSTKDGNWADTNNWSGGVPNAADAIAAFDQNFPANRLISLAGTVAPTSTAIAPTVGRVYFNDSTPSSVLTIAADVQSLKLRSASAFAQFEVTKGNTLAITGQAATSDALSNVSTGPATGLWKLGAGLLDIRAVGSYAGATKITNGILIASTLAGAGTASSIGKAPTGLTASALANYLIIDGGTLRYGGTTNVTTDRGFTIGANGATIDVTSSTAGQNPALIFGPTSGIVSDGTGDRKLTLRGTSTGVNDIQVVISDFSGGKTSIEKLDAGLWQLSGKFVSTGVINPNTYTGDTVVQRGTLRLNFPTTPPPVAPATSYIYPFQDFDGDAFGTLVNVVSTDTILKLGAPAGSGLPGAGILDLSGAGVLQANVVTSSSNRPAGSANPGESNKQDTIYTGAIQKFKNMVVNSGINQITRSAGSAVIYLDNFNDVIHNQGGDLRIPNSGNTQNQVVRVGANSTNYLIGGLNGLLNGWTYMDDTWATLATLTAVASSANNVSPTYKSPWAISPFTAYIDASSTPPDSWNENDSITLPTRVTSLVVTGGRPGNQTPDNEYTIASLRLAKNPLATSTTPNNGFRIAGANEIGFGDPQSVLTIKSGGLLQTSDSGPTTIDGGGLTSGSGDFSTTADPNTGVETYFKAPGGGTLGQSEIFAIVRSGATAGLYISSEIKDYTSIINSTNRISTGITKSGTGNLVLWDSHQNGPSTADQSAYQGDNYINEGGLIVRVNNALGATVDTTDGYYDPSIQQFRSPNKFADGTHGQTYLLGTTSVLDFQGIHYTAAEKVNISGGEIRASLGRTEFAGYLINKNDEAKAVLNIGGYLEIGGLLPGQIIGAPGVATPTGGLSGVAGFQKIGTGLLVVDAPTTVSNVSEFVNAGDLELLAGNTAWNGNISITNGSMLIGNVASTTLTTLNGAHSINGGLTIVNGHLVNTASVLAMTGAGATYDTDLQLTGITVNVFGSIKQATDNPVTLTGLISNPLVAGVTSQIQVNGSMNFGAAASPVAFTDLGGTFTQIGNVNSRVIPTTTFNGVATFQFNTAATANTVTLNHNTIFTQAANIGGANLLVNLVANGIGTTTFKNGLNIVNSSGSSFANVTLTKAVFEKPFTLTQGNLTLNGFDVFNNLSSGAAFTYTGSLLNAGSFAEQGTRRSPGVYGVRNTFNGDLVVGNTTGNQTIAPTFSGANAVNGNIVINAIAGFSGFTTGIANVTLANGQALTGALNLNGGQVTIASSNALGAGTTGGGAGVNLNGEKSLLLLQRGVATQAGEDITFNYSTAYLSGVAPLTFGTAPGITVSGGGPTTTAVASGGAGSQIQSVPVTNVGGGYTSLPTVTASGGSATFAAVMGSQILRAIDQHAVVDGNIIFNNVSGGKVALGIPLISVGQDDSLEIKGNIFGYANDVTAGSSRQWTTGLIGGQNNSSSGTLILSGQIRDISSGASSGLNVLRSEFVGSNDLNIQMEQDVNSNGMMTLAQGVLRFTAGSTISNNFFSSGVTGKIQLSVASDAAGHQSLGYNAQNGTAAFFLTKDGQALNTPGFTVYSGNADKVGNSGANVGYIVIGGENTSGRVTYGDGTRTGTITLDTDTGSIVRDLRLFANMGGTVEIQSQFARTGSGTGSIDKVGDGRVVLSGSTAAATNTLARTYVLGGTLELTNFGPGLTADRLGNQSAIILGGGTLLLNTTATTAFGWLAANQAITQTLPGAMVVRNGLSGVQAQSNGLATTLTLGSSSQTFNRNIGGAVRFSLVGTGAAINIAAPASTYLTKSTAAAQVAMAWGVYGTALSATDVNAGTNFIYVDSSNAVKAYTQATAQDNVASFTANGNFQENGVGYSGNMSAIASLNTIRFNGVAAAGKGVINLNNQNAASATVINTGILLSSDATTTDRSIINGNISASGSNDLIIQNWGGDGVGVVSNNAPKLTIGAVIKDNSTPGSSNALTVVGDGRTVLTATNTFKGDVYISGGTLQVATQAQLGADPSGFSMTNPSAIKTVLLDGGTLNTTSNFTWTNRNITVSGDRSTINVAAGTTFTLTGGATTNPSGPLFASTGGINSQSPEVTTLPTTGIGYGSSNAAIPANGSSNIFQGDLVFDGSGVFQQIRDGVANTIAGQIIVTNGTKLSFEGNNGGFMGNNLSWMDSTTVKNNATLEIRPTTGTAAAPLVIGEYLHLSGTGATGSNGALTMIRPAATVAGSVDHFVSWTGSVMLDGNASISVDDSVETVVPAIIGTLTFDDNIVDGGAAGGTDFTLTKNGTGMLRFLNNRIENLAGIAVTNGELRFEAGIVGTIGSSANKAETGGALVPSSGDNSAYNNYFSGTKSIVVGTGVNQAFTLNPRLSFIDARGTHNANIALNGGSLMIQSADAPLQGTNFAGNFTLTGLSSTNSIEASYTTRINPVVMFGEFNGTGGFTKFGNNEIDFVNGNSTFSGDLTIARGGGGTTSPGVGLFDGGRFQNVSSIHISNDGSLHLDNRSSLNGISGDDNQLDRISDSAAIHLSGNARLRMLGNGTADSSETMGDLLLHRGSSSVELAPGASEVNIGLTFASFQRDAGSVVNFRVLSADTEFATGTGTKNATITIGTLPTLIGGTQVSPFDDPRPDLPVVKGAFGGVVFNDIASLASNSTFATLLNKNDQPFAGRNFMTVETVNGTNYLRPLKASEYLNATRTGFKVTDTYDFGGFYMDGDPADQFTTPGHGPNQNVRLTGGFGPSTTSLDEALFATEGLYALNQGDTGRKQDSLYRVLTDVTFNTLSFAQQTTELMDNGGNRIILEIDPQRALTIQSGMILHAGVGVISYQDPVSSHLSTQSALIRGGTLQFGTNEAIIQNVAVGFNETTGAFNYSARLGLDTTIAGNNIGPSDLTISSTIAGSGGLMKSGLSPVNLSGVNTYTGTTNITEGLLRLENSQALGGSTRVIVSGTGELRLQRGISVGDAANPHTLRLRFTGLSQTSQLRSEAGDNSFYGDIQIDTANAAGERFATTAQPYDVIIANGTGTAFVIGGDIYGLNSSTTTVGTSPLNGRGARMVNFQNGITVPITINGAVTQTTLGGITNINGSFRDLQSGAVTGGLVSSANDAQVLRSVFTGNNASVFNVGSSWDAAGSLSLRQGTLRFAPLAGATEFFTSTAANAINPFNIQARPVIGDAVTTGDVMLSLTAANQYFNSPTLNIQNNSNGNVILAGENTTGTVRFFNTAVGSGTGEFFDANLRSSTWDHNVRLQQATGGTMEVYGRITDSSAGTGLGSILKMGGGTVIMKGMSSSVNGVATPNYVVGTSNLNDFDRGIAVGAGRLVLDYDTGSATAANVWGNSTVGATLGGGKLELRSSSFNITSAQAWSSNGGITLRPGSSELASVSVGSGTVNLTITSALVRSSGATSNFVTSGSSKINLATASTNLNTTLNTQPAAAWATFGSSVGVVSDFATLDASRNVISFANNGTTNYTTGQSGFSAGQYVSEAAGGFNGSIASGVKLVRFGAPTTSSTLTLPTGFTMGNGAATIVDEGAFLVPTGVSALKTISGGDLTVSNGGATKELFFHNFGTGGLTVNSIIQGLNMPVVISGTGTTSLLGENRFNGAVFINDGTVVANKLTNANRSVDLTGVTAGNATFAVADLSNIRVGSVVTSSNGMFAAGVTVTAVNSNAAGGPTITLSSGALTAGGTTLTVTPTSVITGVTVTFNGNTTANVASTSGLGVGQTLVGVNIPNGTTITAVNTATNTVTLSGNVASSANGAVTAGYTNSLGLSSNSSANVNFNNGTLLYTGPSVTTDRSFTIYDGGATVNVQNAAATITTSGSFVGSTSLGTLNGMSAPNTNPYAGGLIKDGPGGLFITGSNTYTGVTEIKGGSLTVTNQTMNATNGPLGTSTNAFDGTIVRGGATLRFQMGADIVTPEYLTFDQGATFDVTSLTTARNVTLNGINTFNGTTNFTYNGLLGGTSSVSMNANAGYMTGSGTIIKGTVNNGQGGILNLTESSPSWTGGLQIEGGRVYVKSVGSPTGSGTGAGSRIMLGTAGPNDLSTTTSNGFTDARLIFQLRDVVDANGGTSLTGSGDTFQVNVNVLQDIVVNRPSSATTGVSNQTKQIGIINPGLSSDQYNLKGDIFLNDDLQFYVEENFLNVNAGGEFVNFNLDGHLHSSVPGGYDATFSTKLNVTGQPVGYLPGAYNNIFATVSLNNSNPEFTGNLKIGNTADISNPDLNHVLRLNNDLALNAANKITLLSEATLQVTGHNVTIGSLVDGIADSNGSVVKSQTTFAPNQPETTGNIISGARAIVENGSVNAATLRVVQTENAVWSFLIRDGLSIGGVGAASLKLIKDGPATVTIVNSNYYTGGTDIVGGGQLFLRNSGGGSPLGTGRVNVIGSTLGGANVGAITGELHISPNADGSAQGVISPGRFSDEGIASGGSLFASKVFFDANTNGFGSDRAEFDVFSRDAEGELDRVFASTLTINTAVELKIRIDASKTGIFNPGDPSLLSGDYVRLFVAPQGIFFGPNGSFLYNGRLVGNGSDLNITYLDPNNEFPNDNALFRLQVNEGDVRIIAVPEPNVALTLASGIGLLVGLQRFRRRSSARA